MKIGLTSFYICVALVTVAVDTSTTSFGFGEYISAKARSMILFLFRGVYKSKQVVILKCPRLDAVVQTSS